MKNILENLVVGKIVYLFKKKKSNKKNYFSIQMISSLFNRLTFIIRSKSLFFIGSKSSKS